MRYPTEIEDSTVHFEVPDYHIDDFHCKAGTGIYGISVEFHSCSEEFSVYGNDQDGGEHDVTEYFSIDEINKLWEKEQEL